MFSITQTRRPVNRNPINFRPPPYIFLFGGAYLQQKGKEGKTMPKKKKAKVRKLTEQQYNDYLMALKDERPTMVADKDGGLHPQK